MHIKVLIQLINSCGTGSGNVLQHLGGLCAGSDDPLTILVTDDLAFLLLLRSLPDLNFTAATDDPNPHGGEEIVGSIRVHVHTAVEHGGCILANA